MTKTNPPPIITVDTKRYDHFLKSSGLSPEEREFVLQELWNLIVLVIDMGFRVEETSLACGEAGSQREMPHSSPKNGLSLSDQNLVALLSDDAGRDCEAGT